MTQKTAKKRLFSIISVEGVDVGAVIDINLEDLGTANNVFFFKFNDKNINF